MKGKIIAGFMILCMCMPFYSITNAQEKSRDYTHTVMVEVGTATWCPYCHYTNLQLHNIYSSGNYDFEYVEMVVDKNSQANQYMNTHYNLAYLPTTFFDGGYEVLVGGYNTPSPYTSRMDTCGARSVPDIYATLTVLWLGNAQIQVIANIQNNESTTYSGHIRAFVSEINSRWYDYYGDQYHHAFLGFALDESISIDAGGTYTTSAIWDGSAAGYPDIVKNNIQVVLAVYNATGHQAYSDPPDNNHPFTAYYVDETTAAMPVNDTTSPTVSNVTANPQIQDMYGYVNITAEATDDAGISQVVLTVHYPDGSNTSFNMNHIAGTDIYYYNTTYSMPGNYLFYVIAYDYAGNTGGGCPNFFYIRDIIPPTITDAQANPVLQIAGKYVNITANVTDNYGMGSVRVNITYPDATHHLFNMQNIGGTDTYYYNSTFSMIGNYSCVIEAEDVDGNTNTAFTSFSIYGTEMNISLLHGWNLITLPCQHDYNASTLLNAIPYCSMILKWNASSQDFIPYLPGSPYDFEIEDGHGYFVSVASDSWLYITGPVVENVAIPLLPGWNALGWFKGETTTAKSILENITSCNTVLVWNASSQDFVVYINGSPYNPAIHQGDGFFVAVSQQSQWHGEG